MKSKDKFLCDYNKAVSQIEDIEEIVNELNKKDINRIFFVGSGGAYTKFVDLRPMLFKNLNLPFIIVSPEELINLYLNKIDEKTLIIAGTKSGETKELIDALKTVRNISEKIIIMSFIGDNNTSLDNTNILNYRISSVDTDVHLILFGWFILLYSKTNLDELKIIKNQLNELGENIIDAILENQNYCKENIEKVDTSKMQMWVGSGNLWGEICCFCNYILEEIQWINAQAIHSCEFFHGPFELVSNCFNVNVVLSSDEKLRNQDMRVLNFVKQHTTNYFVIDMKNFKLNNLNEQITDFVEPYILNHYFDMMLSIYTNKTGKSSKTRRYYRLTEY